MASGKQKFPPQSQEQQPGKEHGKEALVTGGDSGIGKAVCYCFAKEGASVAFTYVKGQEDEYSDKTMKMLMDAKTSDARDPIAIAADVRFHENCREVIGKIVEVFGQIDILTTMQLSSTCQRQLKKSQNLGLKGFSEPISSQSFSWLGGPQVLDYSATKGAILAFTRGLSQQLISKGIRVNAVAPPASLPEEMIQRLGSAVPMQRAAQPFEIAPSYVFLASNQDSFLLHWPSTPSKRGDDRQCLIHSSLLMLYVTFKLAHGVPSSLNKYAEKR